MGCSSTGCRRPPVEGKKTCQYHLDYQREYKKRKPERFVAGTYRHRTKIRLEVIAAYGGKCAICGENDPVVLDIDHVNGWTEGAKGGSYLAMQVKREGYPDTYQILCANCHRRKTAKQREWGKRAAYLPHDGRKGLTMRKAELIRARVNAGERRKVVAAEFGVSRQMVDLIVSGKRWNPDQHI